MAAGKTMSCHTVPISRGIDHVRTRLKDLTAFLRLAYFARTVFEFRLILSISMAGGSRHSSAMLALITRESSKLTGWA
jgi:hypothetical protein